ncbi:MAG: ATP/GTP-binding protein [bacterium]|nr:MAG: ATP/GTP-binding protein [bacterium]KAF0150598.1 MAG: ATP/GTP-binding protein [bacterium]KAF0169451.1 MAG: ATP/GTP-binding protein [bacterium]TXT19753.1 MAG: ATP/GTP-binding protein [bacterium]
MRLILFFFLFTAGVAQAASLLLDKTIAGFASPESVVVVGNDVFVSNLGEKLEPMQKDGDGFISRLDRHGNVKTLKWAADLHGPKGMIAVGGVLYVADIDRVVGFRIGDGKRVFELDLAATGARFLNAFARIDEHRLLLSATDLGKVFVIDVKAKKFSELAFDVPPRGPNGMKQAGNQLIIVEWGSDGQANGGIKTYRLQGASAKLDKQYDPSPAGYFDGVVNMGANRWLVSNWVAFEPVGVLLALDSASGQVTRLRAPVPLAGPADIFLDDQGKLWVPGMMEGKVHRMTLRR